MEKDKIKFGVIGCGHIGKRHATMVLNNSDCELVSLCDERHAAETKTEAYNVAYFNELDQMLKQGPEFDVLCVATPNGLHETHAIQALRGGKHVVVEKPMALTKAGC